MKRIPLYLQILIGLVVGVVIGFVAIAAGGEAVVNDWIRPFGNLFIKALVLVAVPLVFVTLVNGVAELKDTSSLSRLGGRTVVIYLLTTVFAVLVGMGSALVMRPGDVIGDDVVAEMVQKYADTTSTIQSKQATT